MSATTGVTQTAADLRVLVARYAGVGRRVAVLSADAALAEALTANGATLLVDPPSLEALEAFAPQVVVGFDGLLGDEGLGLSKVLRAAPDATLLLSFANAASATAALRGLAGLPARPGRHEAEVRGWLAQAGFAVTQSLAVVVGHEAVPLAAETQASLRQLFEQLNPRAAVDRVLLVAQRGVAPPRVDRAAGLTSVVVAGDQKPSLKGTLGALARGLHRPLEVVVATPLPETELDALVAPLKGRLGFTVRVVAAPAALAEAFNAGAEVATGQYLGFMPAGDLPEPGHFAGLVGALQQSARAWAVTRAEPTTQPPGAFSLAAWVRAGACDTSTWLVDLTRLGEFSLRLAAEAPGAELALFTRLGALFTPALVDGPPSVSLQTPLRTSPSTLDVMLAARPLQRVVPVDLAVAPPAEAPPSLGEQLEARLASQSPWLGRLARRVRVAAEAARAELEQGRGPRR